MRLATLNWPPISVLASNSVTAWPRSAATVAQASPAGPAPTTATRLRCGGRVDQLGLVRGARIDQAAGQLAFEHVVQAGLVAGDAGVDRVGAAGAGLGRPVGSASSGRASDTMSAPPPARMRSATSGMLMRLVVTSGTLTCGLSLAVTPAKAARGTWWRWSGCALRASRCRC
jgi:hypothetical protein